MCNDNRQINKDIELKDNAMLKVRPDLFYEWDFYKNENIDIYAVNKSKNIDVWWICSICNNNYNISILKRVKNKRCPYCSGRRINETNSLEKMFPDLIKEWDFNKNKIEDFSSLFYRSNAIRFWICLDCSSSYDMRIYERTVVKNKCPYCRGMRVNHTNSLGSLFPKISKEWHPTKNGNLTPNDVSYGSKKYVWWLCSQCQSDYLMKPNGKTSRTTSGCGYCHGLKVNHTNSLATTNPELAEQWHPTKNGSLTPHDVTKGSDIRVWWICEMGHEWSVGVNDRYQRGGTRCPNCKDSLSMPERIMYSILKQLGLVFEIEKTFMWSNRKRYDFYIPCINTIVEMHGEQHYKEGMYGMTALDLKVQQENDSWKRSIAKINGIDNYIEVRADISNLDYIKENILKSELLTILKLDNIDWGDIRVSIQLNIHKEIFDLWKSGKSIELICKQTRLSRTSINRILKDF